MLVHKLRLQRGWSQEQLAELSGLSTRTIQRIERGQSASVESLKALAAVFEVDFQQLHPEADMSESATSASSLIPIQADEALALQKVRRIKGFYIHLTKFILVIAMLAVVNAVFSPRFPWVLFVIVGWGISVLMHGLRVFDRIPFLGPQWERAKVEKLLRRSL